MSMLLEGAGAAVKEQAITDRIDRQPAGHTLAQAFYRDHDIYEREIDRIFLRSWLYAGHASEIPEVGDWILFEFADESVIVVRSAENQVNALLNVCRHRGSRICEGAKGRAKLLRCPYHGWSYDLQGRLRAAAHMGDSFDSATIGLRKIHVGLLDGLIFVNFADDPTPFSRITERLASALRPYRLDRARVVERRNYPIAANWKLALENYCECYHCAPAHPAYSKSHSLSQTDARTAELNREVMARSAACGLSELSLCEIYRDSPGFGADCQFDRYALWPPHLTGSRDGRPLGPLLGEVIDYDGGTTDLQVGPVSFALIYCDHVVTYRFTPRSIDTADCDISWLVHADAVEGRDYDKDELVWLWDHTTHEDKSIIERNQKGVNSRYYVPGPFSMMESHAGMFVEWYLDTMRMQEPA